MTGLECVAIPQRVKTFIYGESWNAYKFTVRKTCFRPIERMRRVYGDGSGFQAETYHGSLCEKLDCAGCGPREDA